MWYIFTDDLEDDRCNDTVAKTGNHINPVDDNKEEISENQQNDRPDSPAIIKHSEGTTTEGDNDSVHV